jgi:hypothetical protein
MRILAWLCYLTAAVIFWMLFFGSNATLSPRFSAAGLALVASGLVLDKLQRLRSSN